MDAAVQLRKTLQPTFEAAGTRLTFMPIFIKAASMALSKHPVINRSFPCSLPVHSIAHAQGSSGVVDTMPFAWRGHTKSLTTRARPSPDLAVRLE